MAPSLLDFYIGDTVEVFHPEYASYAETWYVQHYNDYRGLLVLSSNADGTGWLPTVNVGIVRLLQRGNLFKHLFGFPLEFADIIEEISFWNRAGQIRTITNPMSLNLVWSLDQATKALSCGRADTFQSFEGLNSPKHGWSNLYVYKATDIEIGRRLRQPSLQQLLSYQYALKA